MFQLLFSAFLFASGPKTVTCTMEHINTAPEGQQSIQHTINAVSGDGDDSAEGLTHGNYDFSFYLEYSDDEDGRAIYATFYENNSVQDEVGDWGCLISDDEKGRLCEETIKDFDGKPTFKFYCELGF